MSTPPVELPVQPTSRSLTRAVEEVRGMAVAIQANLVQLQVDASRRHGRPSMPFDYHVEPPGVVRAFRETLIDRHEIRRYSEVELGLRTHEIWGQYCLMRWVFNAGTPTEDAFNFAKSPEPLELRCDSVLSVKLDEIHGLFWRIRFEQRDRGDAGYRVSESFAVDQEIADRIPDMLSGKPVSQASDAELLCAACEFVGMLSTLRWVVDRRHVWGEPGIGEVGARPL